MNELCKSIGGYLVELDSLDEQNFVTRFVKAHRQYSALTGANDVEREGTFVYYNSKKPMPALKWRYGNPNNWRNKEHCVQILSTGVNDIHCRRYAQYICEIRV
ncbi:collectin-11 [Plakobranchus ocellatus]|uniref:Collectin-11 n=1 Tax=Plakobranchus ocellatus TaxID=259542 RepID=A0AAV3ZKJ8_9GAST|nr:collectin-11 [Plakobranchus ocellatus]